ncbi:hypothetical protein F4001_07380 [Candidatus Poribacteria bacterium]|nr:hypothetical protein [Candidatus Poribacteria bacterium]
MNTGKRANSAGKQLASFVDNLLHDYGYVKVSQSRFFALRALEQPIYAQECNTGKTLYGGTRRVDFILYHPKKWSECLVIECKWQSGRGSVDQKYPYFVLSANMNPEPAIFVVDGDGYSGRSKEWLQAQSGKERILHILNQGEFARFVSEGNL